MKLLSINPQPPIDPSVIERLTEVCGAIERDEVSAVAVAYVNRDGSTGSSYSASTNVSMLLGAVARLQYRLLKIGE